MVTDDPSKTATPAPPPGRHGWAYMSSMGMMVAGFVSVDAITNNMVPITCRHFTDSPFLIALLVALNRLFGFLVQPYVAWKSDRIQTRWGRRRPFLILGLPATCLSLVLLGVMPFVFQGASRQSFVTLVLLLIANVAMQFFQDVNWGSQEPLYADTFPQKELGRAAAIRSYFIQGVYLFMNYFAMKWADRHEFIPYACAAGLVMVSFVLVLSVVRERPFPPPTTGERYNPVAHLGLLVRNSDYAKVSVLGAFGLMLPAAFFLFHSLFVTRTLGLSKGQLGEALAVIPIAGFVVALPCGYLIDRYGPKGITIAGFALLALVSWSVAYWVHDKTGLLVAMAAYGAGYAVMSLPMTPMVFQYASDRDRGTIFGLIQFVRGFSAFIFSLGIGGIVQFSSSSDPTPFYAEDFRDAPALAQRIAAQRDPLAAYVHGRLGTDARAQLQGTDAAAAKSALVTGLNALLKEPELYAAERFQGVVLSRQSRAFLERTPATERERIVFNRSILQDAFAKEISRQPDYRMAYLLSFVIAVLGAAITFTTRAAVRKDV